MVTVKTRMIQICEVQRISKREFCKQIGVSSTYLATNGDVYSSVLIKVLNEYDKINIEWLLKGEGDMFVDEVDKNVSVDDQHVKLLIEANNKLSDTNAKLVDEMLAKKGLTAGEDVGCADVG